MRRLHALPQRLLPVLACLGMSFAAWAQADLAEVYSAEALAIRAGIEQADDEPPGFGSVFRFVIVAEYDPEVISIDDPGEALFTSAWTPAEGVYLRNAAVERGRAEGTLPAQLQAGYEFQFLACPDSSRATCPGDREYRVPAFTLVYEDLRTDSSESASFRLPTTVLTVKSVIERDAEDQLFPFEVYFPNGGYPDPRTGRDGTRAALLVAGLGLVILTGGILMWPFRSRKQEAEKDAVPRWKKQLDALGRADPADEARYLDGLRRCLVWYCNDELEADAFVWLDLAERGDEVRDAVEDDVSFNKLRDLFVELLHNPRQKGPELRSRLEALIARGGHA